MSEIARRVWHEPAVFIGLLVCVAEIVIKLATGDPWDTIAIAAVVAPLATALGIRQLVTPAAEVKHVADLTPEEKPPASSK